MGGMGTILAKARRIARVAAPDRSPYPARPDTPVRHRPERTGGRRIVYWLLFALFLLVMIFTLLDKEKLSFITYGVAIAIGTAWFIYHSTTPLTIQL